MKKTLFKIGLGLTPFLFLLSGISQVRAEPYGWSPSVDNSWQGTPQCTSEKPKAPILYQPNHPLLAKASGKGQIRLQWTKVPNASGYNIFYGLSPKNYIYSVPNLPDTDNYTVSFLANKKYYFAVSANAGCAGSSTSNEWWGRPGAGGYGAGTTLGVATTVKKTSVSKTPKAVPSPKQEKTAEVLPSPTTAPQVQGAQTGPADQGSNYQPPQYNPPQAPPAAVPVTPKPKSFFQNIISILFGR